MSLTATRWAAHPRSTIPPPRRRPGIATAALLLGLILTLVVPARALAAAANDLAIATREGIIYLLTPAGEIFDKLDDIPKLTGIHEPCWLPNGHLLVAVANEAFTGLMEVDPVTHQIIREVPLKSPSNGMSLGPGGFVYVVTDEGTLVLDLAPLEITLVNVLELTGVSEPCWLPNGHFLQVIAINDNETALVEVDPAGTLLRQIPTAGVKITGLACDPVTGNLILTTEQDIREIDPRTGKLLRTIFDLAGYENPHWLPSGYLAVTGPLGSSGISVIDTTLGEVVDIIAPNLPATAFTVNPTRLTATLTGTLTDPKGTRAIREKALLAYFPATGYQALLLDTDRADGLAAQFATAIVTFSGFEIPRQAAKRSLQSTQVTRTGQQPWVSSAGQVKGEFGVRQFFLAEQFEGTSHFAGRGGIFVGKIEAKTER